MKDIPKLNFDNIKNDGENNNKKGKFKNHSNKIVYYALNYCYLKI